MKRQTKSERLSVDPNNTEGAKKWTFENYIESVKQAKPESDPT